MEELLTLKDLLVKGVEEGSYEVQELEKLVNQEEIINRALALILPGESN